MLRLRNEVKQRLGVSKVNLKQVKQHLSSNQEFITFLKNSELGKQAFEQYQKSVARLKDPRYRKHVVRLVRKGMSQPRARFKGCLATKIDMADYKTCLDNYDDPKYDNMSVSAKWVEEARV